MPYQPILERNFDNGRDFIRALDLTEPHFQGANWLFRGHGKLTYKLQPSVFRPESQQSIEHAVGFTSRTRSDWEWASNTGAFHVLRECEMLLRFAEAIDSGGMRIPGNGIHTITHLEELRRQLVRALSEAVPGDLTNPRARIYVRPIEEFWPTREVFQLVALARHFGLPSRLLDWTPIASIAAYFACAETVEAENREGRICVWAFKDILLQEINTQNTRKRFTHPVTVLREGNRNLAAQKGMFTATAIHESGWLAEADTMPLEDKIVSIEDELDEPAKDHYRHAMIKFTLDARRATSALWHLRRMGVSRLSVYPDYSSILSDLREDFLTRQLTLEEARENGFPL